MLSLRHALKLPSSRRLSIQIFLLAAVFRLILLPSTPIQEVDFYRYLWDGAVVAKGVNPYQYSPEEIRETLPRAAVSDQQVALRQLADQSPSLRTALDRVHFGELTSVYPPGSQAVFAAAALITPDGASLWTRTVILKSVLVSFDLATLLLVLRLLRSTGRHVAWSIVYGWCPLVLKEVANSGHLDSIAVCLSVAAVGCGVASLKNAGPTQQLVNNALAGILLGLGVSAKLYPVVLLPLLTMTALRRVGPAAAALLLTTAVVTTACSMLPMLPTGPDAARLQDDASTSTSRLPLQYDARLEETPRPESGLTVFLKHWEMNDLIFMLVVENIRPDATSESGEPPPSGPWFVVIPQPARQVLSKFAASWLGLPETNATFMLTRMMTLTAFAAICLALAWKAAVPACRATLVGDDIFPDSDSGVNQQAAVQLLHAAFLTLAWFWALSPTLNPWYWLWALPFLPFAGGRAWFSVSLLLLIYYVRFWLLYHFNHANVLGTPYIGEDFFHYVLVPAEHGLWMGWLLVETLVLPSMRTRSDG